MNLPEHLWISSCDGNLYDTRKDGWSKLPPLREKYIWLHRAIETVAQLKASLRVPYAWPGGYEYATILADGALLCNDCAHKEFRQLIWDLRNNCSTGWKPSGTVCMSEIAESSPCAHCNRELSPYAISTENT